ncbi:hypothetical protein ACFSCX_14270 [Bacillus salitolerans]|uniref:SCP2 domain-containing protein n=1 Tax=Bacillus salitolerans TaxID=1437434 RepID=A0ABW4LT68_9BACI
MKLLLEKFTEVVLIQPNLKPILPVNPLYISFQSGYDLLFLKISSQGCEVFNDCQERTDLWIKGDLTCIQSFLMGKERLRKIESRNQLKITGSFKDILLVESLFALCNIELSA